MKRNAVCSPLLPCIVLVVLGLAAQQPLETQAVGVPEHVIATMSNQNNLVYLGGPVMVGTAHTYAIFWEPPGSFVSSTYNSLIRRYFSDVGNSPLYHNNSQYKDSSGKHPSGSVLSGWWVDTQPYPSGQLSDQQVQAEVTHAMQVKGWTASLTHAFFVFTAKNEVICVDQNTCSFTSFCAYHNYFNNNVIYMAMPYADTAPLACDIPGKSPNHDIAADSEINETSGVQMEAVTDPLFNAWIDTQGYEIADKCGWQFGNVGPDGSNVHWNGHPYIVQEEWDNVQSTCVLAGP